MHVNTDTVEEEELRLLCDINHDDITNYLQTISTITD